MDFGEQTTGTRDEHYNLISVLYHALHGAENCNTYALDAEASGDERLVGFFREAGVTQARLAERAKELLGIMEAPPEGIVSSGTVVEDAPATGAPAAPEDPTPPGDVSSNLPQVATSRIAPEDFERTISVLQGGVENLDLEEALREIDGWEQRLEESEDPELAPIAENLRRLRTLLMAGSIDRATVGELLNRLGEQVQEVASGSLGASVADKLQVLGGVLNTESRSISG